MSEKKISINPEIKINLFWFMFRNKIFLPKKMPRDKKIYWKTAVNIGKKKVLFWIKEKAIPEPIESMDKATPKKKARNGFLILVLIILFLSMKLFCFW